MGISHSMQFYFHAVLFQKLVIQLHPYFFYIPFIFASLFRSICDLLRMLLQILKFSICFAPEKYVYPVFQIFVKYIDICGYYEYLQIYHFILVKTNNLEKMR